MPALWSGGRGFLGGGYMIEGESFWSALLCDWKALTLNDIDPSSWIMSSIERPVHSVIM